MTLFRHPTLNELKRQALDEAEAHLLDAEAAFERATANLDMYRTRVARLRPAVEALNTAPLAERFP